jgi:hypothetical protein
VLKIYCALSAECDPHRAHSTKVPSAALHRVWAGRPVSGAALGHRVHPVVWGGTSPGHTHRHQTDVFQSGETCPEAGSKRALPSDKLGPSPQNRLPVNNVRVRGQVGPYTQHKRDGLPHGTRRRLWPCWSLRTLWKWRAWRIGPDSWQKITKDTEAYPGGGQ